MDTPQQFIDPAAQDMSQGQMSPQDMEIALFGAPLTQAAPELASIVDPAALSASSGNTNTDYSFYTDPSTYLNQSDYSPVDTTTPFYADTQYSDLSQLDPSVYDY